MLRPRMLYIVVLLSCVAAAQDTAKFSHVIRASGKAAASAKPDRAQITIGVVTQAPTAEAAASQNAAQTAQILEAIKSALGAGGEIKTVGYSVSPAYQPAKNGTSPKIIGYNASNAVRVTINDLRLIANVLDASAKAGANQIHGITFTLRDDQALRTEALAQAARKARASAEAIAQALNLRVVGVLQAETPDVSEASSFRQLPAMAQSVEVNTPIEAGSIDVTATVIVTLQVQ